jgi:hypothetical protein
MVDGATVWMNRYSAEATNEAGRKITFRFDPMSDTTSVKPDEAASRFSFPGGVSWEDDHVEVAAGSSSVLGIAPGSAFMAAHQVVTFNPAKVKIVVGAFDASGDCREGHMFFAAQTGSSWRIPLTFDGSPIATASGDFQIGYYDDVFVTPQGFSRQFYRFYQRREDTFRDEGREYTREDAVADSPVIQITMEGGFSMELVPDAYVMGNSDTDFGWSPSRYDIVLPTSILNRMVVQLDAANNRVGICTPH